MALATDPPREDILDRPPDKPSAGLLSTGMKAMICTQSAVQITIMLLLQTIGSRWIPSRMQLRTFVFNTFIFLQLFNEVNCRTLGTSHNIFQGLSKNPYFVLIWVFTFAAQTAIIEFGGDAFGTESISPKLWIISISIGFTSIVVGQIVRLVLATILESSQLPNNEIINANERWQRAYVNVRRSRAFYNAIRRERLLRETMERQNGESV